MIGMGGHSLLKLLSLALLCHAAELRVPVFFGGRELAITFDSQQRGRHRELTAEVAAALEGISQPN